MKTIEEINYYINNQKGKINNKYRLKYHLMPTVGWMNDPNGLVYFNGKYHLFYQYNPYNSLPGTMIWGHSTSTDLINFKDESVALIPILEHSSIFSGGAIVIDNQINAIYTVHYEFNDIKKEEIYLSKSSDGINFDTPKCVFDNELLPNNISRKDFRDPFPIKKGDSYYVLVGGKDVILNKGVIIVLKGKTLDKLEYHFTIGPLYELGEMGECPSYTQIGDKDVLIVSGVNVLEKNNNFKNINSSSFIVGNIDFENKKMDIDFTKEIDKGDGFYAPQFINCIDKPIMIGWMETWGKDYVTHILNHSWSGALTIPRILSIKNNDIYQEPIEINSSLNGETIKKNIIIDFDFDNEGYFKIIGDNGNITINFNKYIYLDTTNANNHNKLVRRTNNIYSKNHIKILIDISSVEIFIDDGKETISSRIFIDGLYEFDYKNIRNLEIKEVVNK